MIVNVLFLSSGLQNIFEPLTQIVSPFYLYSATYLYIIINAVERSSMVAHSACLHT